MAGGHVPAATSGSAADHPRAWREEDASAAARRALAAVGRPGVEVSLIRLGENALFDVPRLGLLVRVARPSRDPAQVALTVTIARTLSAGGFLTAEPFDTGPTVQPLVFDDGAVTIWRRLTETGSPGFGLDDFGALVRRFQEAAAPLADRLPQWDPLGRTRERLRAAAATGARAEWLGVLGARVEEVDAQLAEVTSVLGVGVIHGDAHRGNVLLTAEGPRLIDLDEVCVGPREVDLAPTRVACRRFGVSEAEWAGFSAGYGFDLADSPMAGPLVAWREVAMTVWLLQQHGDAVDAELALRVQTLGGPDGRRWHAR
jgi:hypothetical protein